MPKNFNERLTALRSLLKEREVEALYISKKENAAYFSGRKSDDCSLYITGSDAYIITDFRYREMAKELSDRFEYVETSGNFTVIDFLKSRKESLIGIEDHISLADYCRFKETAGESRLKPVSGLVESLRIIKSPEEIGCLQLAQSIADRAFNAICGVLAPGMSEKEAAARLEYFMMLEGSDGASFDTILVSGAGTSRPHGIPSDKKIETGDFVTMDFGATINGYHSDMTRTVAVGHASEEMKKIYGIVLKAQMNCCTKLRAGMSGIEGDRLTRDIIEEAGYGDCFGHGTGHGAGLEIHEAPRLSPAYGGMLEENMSVTIEPGIYLPGRFGVRIEDLAIVKADGIINLTNSPKDLMII